MSDPRRISLLSLSILVSVLLLGFETHAADTDGDGLSDVNDVCTRVPNTSRDLCDSDGDGFGNLCDGDFDQSGTTDGSDFSEHFLVDFQSGIDSGRGTDMDCDGVVTGEDFLRFLSNFTQGTPGPSARENHIFNPYGVELEPLNVVFGAEIGKSALGDVLKPVELNPKHFEDADNLETKRPESTPQRDPSKISPVLEDWLQHRNPSDEVELIVTFRDDLPMPRLPELGEGEDREKWTRRNDAIETLRRARAESQAKSLARLRQYGELKQDQGFWIVNALSGHTTLGQVKRLAESPDVVYLQPAMGGEKPPADGNPNNDAIDARADIVSDPYFNLSLTRPWIGLLDTGVRDSHDMFNGPDNLAWLRDCVNGGTWCNNSSNPGYDTTDFAWNHGTSSAGILAGNNSLGGAFRGATEVRTDSWQIYTAGGLSTTAGVRAIEAGVAAFDKVLVGEIQANESHSGALATAADNAYDTGVVFVSANGNFGPDASTVRSPAIAHKVLGVGGFMTDGGAQYANQGRGPTADGRIKPDIQAPTYSETASAAHNSALKVFGGTSGATPYASSAAMLADNWLANIGNYDNGQTYAFMILYGQNAYPYNNTVGAGPIEMATNGTAYWGKVAVQSNVNINIPISVGNGRNDFDGALWWPESVSQAHNDIDIHLIDPSGIERARGFSALSVFERAAVEGPLTPGTWTLRIRGFSVPTGSQLVYWAAHVRN